MSVLTRPTPEESHDERAARAHELLERGYPHALEVAPEDLELLRSRQRWPLVPVRIVATGLAVVSFVEGMLAAGFGPAVFRGGVGLMVMLAGFAVAAASVWAATFAWSAAPRLPLRWAGLTLLAGSLGSAIAMISTPFGSWVGVLQMGLPVAACGVVSLALSATLRPRLPRWADAAVGGRATGLLL